MPDFWRRCETCEVYWRGNPECWCCGQPADTWRAPAIGSQHGAGSAFTEGQWAEVRRQIV